MIPSYRSHTSDHHTFCYPRPSCGCYRDDFLEQPETCNAHAMEFEGKIAQVPLETFMNEFVPGPDIPSSPDSFIFSFDRGVFKGKSGVYDELVSRFGCLLGG